MEPNLRFEVTEKSEDSVTIRASFELEFRPPRLFARAAGMDDPWIGLHVAHEDLCTAAADLRRDRAKFSPRTT